MTIPPRQTAEATLPPLEVVWQGNMRFNGRTASFAKQVQVQGSTQLRNQDQLQFSGSGESFHATLTEVVDFIRLRRQAAGWGSGIGV